MQAPDRRSGKEGNDKCHEEAHAADQRFHNGPSLEGRLFIHAHKALDQPETGIVEVGTDGGAASDRSGDTGQIQRAEFAVSTFIVQYHSCPAQAPDHLDMLTVREHIDRGEAFRAVAFFVRRARSRAMVSGLQLT